MTLSIEVAAPIAIAGERKYDASTFCASTKALLSASSILIGLFMAYCKATAVATFAYLNDMIMPRFVA